MPAKGPYIANLDMHSVEIRWEVGPRPPDTALVLGTAVIPAKVSDWIAAAKVGGLAPDREYSYSVRIGRFATAPQKFRTFPQPGSPVRFVVFGDTRTGHDVHAHLVDRIAAEAPDFVANTGDLVYDGSISGPWDPFFVAERPLIAGTPMFPAVGNHDARRLFNESEWSRYFPHERYYEIDPGDVRMIFVDSTAPYESGSAQYAWLRDRLAAAQDAVRAGTADWILVLHHHPVFSSGYHGSERDAQRELMPLYRAYGVDMVLNGHDHIYERNEDAGVVYIVTGGGGAPLYAGTGLPQTKAYAAVHHYLRFSADHAALDMTAIDLDGNTIDHVNLARDRARIPAPIPQDSKTAPIAAVAALMAASAAMAWWWSARL